MSDTTLESEKSVGYIPVIINYCAEVPPTWFLKECFDYTPEGKLFWKKRPVSHFVNERAANVWNGTMPGKEAGTSLFNAKSKTSMVGLNYPLGTIARFSVAHLVLAWNGVAMDGHLVVTHLNKNRQDNRIENLSLEAFSEPQRNYGGPTRGAPRNEVKTLESLPENYLRECFDYNQDTGKLFWKERPVSHFSSPKIWSMWNKTWVGKEAGAKKCRKGSDTRSTIQIGISPFGSKMRLYSAHRIIFALMGKEVPLDMVVDHINNDPWDNRWENLRLITQRQNIRNRGASSAKKNGLPRCVYKAREGRKCQYEARVSLGSFPTVEEALQARNMAETLFFGDVLHREDC